MLRNYISILENDSKTSFFLSLGVGMSSTTIFRSFLYTAAFNLLIPFQRILQEVFFQCESYYKLLDVTSISQIIYLELALKII